jgi:hypothetical protein
MNKTVQERHKRCIVSVATGLPYKQWQCGTRHSLEAIGERAPHLFWNELSSHMYSTY